MKPIFTKAEMEEIKDLALKTLDLIYKGNPHEIPNGLNILEVHPSKFNENTAMVLKLQSIATKINEHGSSPRPAQLPQAANG